MRHTNIHDMKKFILIALVATAGCTTITQNNGAEIRQVKLDQITTDSNKADVFNLLGSPSTKSAYGQETWYYISSQIRRQLLKDDQVLNQEVIAISFKDDKVDNIEMYNTKDRRDFANSDRITPTAGRKLTVIEQLLGNVGKFNTENPNAAIGSRAPSGNSGQQ